VKSAIDFDSDIVADSATCSARDPIIPVCRYLTLRLVADSLPRLLSISYSGEVAAEPVQGRAKPTLFSGLGEKVGSADDGVGSSEYRQKLEMALDELVACRRIIDGVLQQD
jgi:hypothetical protein